MTTPISTFELDGRQYAIVPLELLERAAPQLLARHPQADPAGGPLIPMDGTVPWEVVKRSIRDDVSSVRAWREYLGLTQLEVASRLGISQSALAQIEKAKRPRSDTLRRVAIALGIAYEQLLG